MEKPNNKTPYFPADYDANIRNTLPFYDCFHEETINLIKSRSLEPDVWLDTGCGTGNLAMRALKSFPMTKFILSDPSPAMLEHAMKKLTQMLGDRDIHSRVIFLKPASTQYLTQDKFSSPDVITAILSHHYLSKEAREEATRACYDLLNPDGIYVTFENIRPFTEVGIDIGKNSWRDFQLSRGKDAQAVESYLKRFDVEFFPITVADHLSLLWKAGFKAVEVLWYSRMQAGFYGIK
jgi:tRNA (cmo5U34)-methyltransferase